MDTTPRNNTVRLPFRVLGGLFLIAVLGVLLAAVYTTLAKHTVRDLLIVVVTLPVAALVARSLGTVVVRGHLPRNAYWPFADGRVALVWVVIFAAVIQFATRDA